MSKFKLLLLSIMFSSLTVAMLGSQQFACMIPFALAALLCFSVWLSRVKRDQRIIAQAHQQQLATTIDQSLISEGQHSGLFKSDAYIASLDEPAHAELIHAHNWLGHHPETGARLFIHKRDRYAGTYVLGVQGVGKSGFLQNFIGQDVMSEEGLIVIDPHGDLIDNCIAQAAEHHLSRVYLLDITDEAFPFGINVFAVKQLNNAIAQAQSIDRVCHIFEVLWPETESQQYLPRYLRAAIITLFANPGTTLVDMYRLLTDDQFRQQLLKKVTDPTVQTFWQTQYDELAPTARMQRVGPLVGRLESLFMGRSLIRNIVGQSENTVDFRMAIEERQIIFIKLPIKTLAQDARLIGTMLIAQIHAALFSFADLPEHARPGFSLFVDEFQHFATPDFSEMFTEGRKFGVRVTVAHQYRGQLPTFLQESTMTARTKICFQTTPEDAREMAHLFPNSETTVRPEDIDPKPVEHLLAYGSDDQNTQTFIDVYLRPLQSQKKSGMIEIQRPPALRYEYIPLMLLGVKQPNDKPKETDPTPYLNHLLYEVMRTGNPDLDIPYEVAIAFSNFGNFYQELRYALWKSHFLGSDIQFPPYLVVQDAHGNPRWTRRPEGEQESLYCFIFFLRMTMVHLASEPIGRKSTLGTSEIAQTLLQLPRRAAFVRSGEGHTGLMHTDDIGPMVDAAAALRERLEAIQAQTREKYCKPKSEIEKAPEAKTETEAPAPQWEVME